VHCAALPELGFGVALKVDDGAKRGAERVLVEVLAAFLPKAHAVLAAEIDGEVRNWRGRRVGRLVPGDALKDALQGLAGSS
jgi:L-asparaginase II